MKCSHTGIILAAGRGSRLGGETDTHPKCQTELGGKTLLDWGIEAAKNCGIEHIVVVGGYLKEMLADSSYTLIENPRWSATNMVATLCFADAYLTNGPCIVSYSDIVYSSEWINKLLNCESELGFTYDSAWERLWSLRMENPLSDAESFRQENGFLKSIGEKTSDLTEVNGQFMGLLRTTPNSWAAIKDVLASLSPERRDRLDITSLFQLLLAENYPIEAVECVGKWCEIDTLEDLQCYRQKLNGVDTGNISWMHDWRGHGCGI